MEFVTTTHYYTGDGWDVLRFLGLFVFLVLTIMLVWFSIEEREFWGLGFSAVALLALIAIIANSAVTDGSRKADLSAAYAKHGVQDVGYGKDHTAIGTKDGKLVYCKALDLRAGNKYLIKCFDDQSKLFDGS